MRWNLILITLATLSSVLILNSPAASAPPALQPPSTKVVLRLPWVFQAQFAGPIVAAAKGGAYEKAGLDVELRPGSAQVNGVELVAAGKEDFAIVQPDQLIYAATKFTKTGYGAKCVAVVFPESMSCFMVRKNSGIQDIAGFKGKRVAVKPNTNVDHEYRALMAKYGLDTTKDVTEVPVQWDLGLFVSGQVDVFPGFVVNEPFQVRKVLHDLEILTPKQFGLTFYGDVLIASDKVIQENPKAVTALVSATFKGWEQARTQPDEAVALILDRAPMSQSDHQRFMLDASLTLLGNNTAARFSDPAIWDSTIQLLQKYGSLPASVVNARDLFDNSFLQEKSSK